MSLNSAAISSHLAQVSIGKVTSNVPQKTDSYHNKVVARAAVCGATIVNLF